MKFHLKNQESYRMARILSVCPSIDYLAALNRALTQCGHQVRGADTRVKALSFVKSFKFDFIVLCDEFLPASEATLADELRASAPGTPILTLRTEETNPSPEELEGLLASGPIDSIAA
jgi:DNA-binding response OmpR family regulator